MQLLNLPQICYIKISLFPQPMQLKAKILVKLNSIDDEKKLKEIYDWLEAFMDIGTRENFESGEIQAVKEGYEQYLAGNTISEEEASIRFDQWLTEKGK